MPGEIGIVYEGPDGTTHTDRNARYDFGEVYGGQQVTGKITVRNLGVRDLSVAALDPAEGDTAQFHVEFEPRVVRPGERTEYPVQFDAPLVEVKRPYSATFVLRAEGTRLGEETAQITLTGTSVPYLCDLQRVLDFGNVGLGDSSEVALTLSNPTSLPVHASLDEIISPNGDQFAFAMVDPSSNGIELAPQSTHEVRFTFHPSQKKTYVAYVKARAADDCPEQTITLTGAGVDQVLTWSPAKVDFGEVKPGTTATAQITFTNSRDEPIELRDLAINDPDEFHLPEDVTSLMVPGKGGTATLTVACTPANLGPRFTSLHFTTPLMSQPEGEISLSVVGGGPDIEVASELDFGKAAYFANASPGAFISRRVTIRNLGTSPLFLGMDDGAGDIGLPYIALAPENPNTAAGEFTVAIPASYDPTKGIAPGGSSDLVVTFTPSSLGKKQARISIFSNDRDDPRSDLTVTAEAVAMSPCSYSVANKVLGFGRMTPPDDRELGFTIQNTGTSPCLLSGLDLGAATDEMYALPAGPIANEELQPGEEKEIRVRAYPHGGNPTGISPVVGTIDFFLSSPTQPSASVSVNAELGPSCLVVSPDEFDFGDVKVGCGSATRTFNLYNTCPNAVTISSIGMQSGSSSEFVLTSSIPNGGAVLTPGSAPLSFQVKYEPTDSGADTGAVNLAASEGGSNVTYVVPVHGRGETQGLQTDTFALPATPEADVLMIADVSSSCDLQQQVALHYAEFTDYATTASVDFHFAATTTDVDPGGQRGRFLFGTLDPDRILTPSSPNLQGQFIARVQPGCVGSTTTTDAEPILRALTVPLVNAENSGFLRPEASLGIVVVTDEPDQSPESSSYYLDRFSNLKGVNRANDFSFSVIGPCSGSGSEQLARYAKDTHGIAADVCTVNSNNSWSSTLEEIGDAAFGKRRNWYLSKSAALGMSGLELEVDGTVLDPVDAQGNPVWTYDAAANAITFEPASAPQPGQTLTISYPVACY